MKIDDCFLDKKNIDDVLLIVYGAFLGWITSSMLASYIANHDIGELKLVLFFSTYPTSLEKKIIEEEILFNIKEGVYSYGIKSVRYDFYIVQDGLGTFKQKNIDWFNNHWPIFYKYEPMIYDSYE